jgi:hypothetical protein
MSIEVNKTMLIGFLENAIELNSKVPRENDLAKADGQGLDRGLQFLLLHIRRGELDIETNPTPIRTPINQISTPVESKVRRHGMGTSWDAALSVTPEKSQAVYRWIYAVLQREGPLTDDQIEAYFTRFNIKHSISGLRARRSELRDAGWVRDSGRKRPSNAGHPSTVWEAIPE